jgi:hypothetical protein
MISQKINRPVFHTILKQDLPFVDWHMSQDSFAFNYQVNNEPLSSMVDEFFRVFDGETIQEVQKNINRALTASKHLLSYNKQDLIWFQRSLARMKSVRGAIKN